VDKVVKLICLMLSGSALWVIFVISLPVHQMLDTKDLTINATDSFISQAYADESKSKKHKNKKHKNKDKDKDKKHKNKKHKSESKSDDESTESSSSYDFSNATLICISRSTVLSALNSSSEGGDSESESDESDESDEDSSTTVTQSYITSLPGCTVFASPTVAGIWIPFTTITTTNSDDNEISLNSAMILDYFTQLGANTTGLTGTPPNSTMVSYREMLGE